MPTGSCIHALNEYASLYQRFGTIPISWNVQKKKFVYQANHRELRLWYFNMSFVVLGTLGCCFICVREIFVKVTNIPTYVLVMQIFWGLLGGVLGCGVGLLFFIYGQEGVLAWENLVIIEVAILKGKYINTCPLHTYNKYKI